MDCSSELPAPFKVSYSFIDVVVVSIVPALTGVIHRNLVAVALGQKLAILAADDAELERHSTVSIDACSLPEQITTLCWIAYANLNEGTTTTVLLVRVSLQSVAQCSDTDLSQLILPTAFTCRRAIAAARRLLVGGNLPGVLAATC